MKKLFSLIKISLYVLIPLVLFLLPADFFDEGESLCLSRFIFDIECYACGMTRGVMHALHLDFETAYAYHMLSIPLTPLLGIIWLGWLWREWKFFRSLSSNPS